MITLLQVAVSITETMLINISAQYSYEPHTSPTGAKHPHILTNVAVEATLTYKGLQTHLASFGTNTPSLSSSDRFQV
jgi:hypothetical protein